MRTGSDPGPDTGTRAARRVIARRAACDTGRLVDAIFHVYVHVRSFSLLSAEAKRHTIVGLARRAVLLTAAPLIRIKNVLADPFVGVGRNCRCPAQAISGGGHVDLSEGKQCCRGANSVKHDSV